MENYTLTVSVHKGTCAEAHLNHNRRTIAVQHSYLYMHGLNIIGFCQRVEQRLFGGCGSGVLRYKCLYAH